MARWSGFGDRCARNATNGNGKYVDYKQVDSSVLECGVTLATVAGGHVQFARARRRRQETGGV